MAGKVRMAGKGGTREVARAGHRCPGPLTGVRVLDLTRAFGGPFATMILGEMGADVTKIEEPDRGDESRTFPPIMNGVSGYFSALNRNKKSVAINLKQPAGREIVQRLAAVSDVLVENFTPGVAARLGLSYDEVRKLRPDIVYCSISGFGQTGPYRERKGYDPVLQAMGGLMGVTGEKNGGPIKSMVPMADISAGLLSVQAILAALYHRKGGGPGQYIDMAMFDIMVSLLTTVGTNYLNTGVVPPRSGTENPVRAPSAAFECADGNHIQLVPNQRQWESFCEIVGAPELAVDARFATNVLRVANSEALYSRLRPLFKTRNAADWHERMLAGGIPAGPIYTLDQLFADPQVIARGMVAQWDDAVAGTVRGIKLPFRMSRTPVEIRSLPPQLGEHTTEVLQSTLDLSPREIDQLRKENVL